LIKNTRLSSFVASILLLIALFYLFVLQVRAIWAFTIDDMYITLRYAKNWANGFGLVWNFAEPPVEGYSNFSFLLLARSAIGLHFNPVVVLKLAGVIGLFFTCCAMYVISRMWLSRCLAFIPCLWLLAYKGQIIWSVSGLETTVYQALVCYSVFFIFRGWGYSSADQRNSDARPIFTVIAGLLLALAGMTRPEAPALMLLFTILLLSLRTSLSGNNNRQGVMLFCISLFVCFAPYFFWRLNYYGRLFPNPVYCKGVTSNLAFDLDKHYLRLIWPYVLTALPAMVQSRDRRHYFLWLPSVLYCLLLMGADPIVAFENRLFLPVFALLLPLSVKGLAVLLTPYMQHQKDVFNFAMYLSAFLLAFFFIPMLSLSGYRYFTENPLAGERLRHKVVIWLRDNTRPDSRVVLGDSGLIPYESQRQFIDSYCLNNAAMAKLPSATMYQRMCENVLDTKPDVIILTALLESGKTIYAPTDACLSIQLARSNYYCLRASLRTGTNNSIYRYEIFMAC
jgi:hypothetical protein